MRRLFVVALLSLAALGTAILTYPLNSVQRVAFACDRQSCWPVDPPAADVDAPFATDAPFTESAIDLTGDGVPETILREDETLRVLQGDVEIWCSDPAWRVVDATLGDPNDDGRYEILAALWKPDDEATHTAGGLGSYPFIIGHRGGAIKVIWGGSAVAHGIHEVALADVDGDKIEELLVLESAWSGDGLDAAQRTLSVWDWHGWGFNLRWRSAPGRYRDLGLAEGGIIVVTVEE
ncbi:MAG: hypothetical protein ACP5J4_01260 [Anaerolineae bacterium]